MAYLSENSIHILHETRNRNKLHDPTGACYLKYFLGIINEMANSDPNSNVPVSNNCHPSLFPEGNSLYSAKTASIKNRLTAPNTIAITSARYLFFHSISVRTDRIAKTITMLVEEVPSYSPTKQTNPPITSKNSGI